MPASREQYCNRPDLSASRLCSAVATTRCLLFLATSFGAVPRKAFENEHLLARESENVLCMMKPTLCVVQKAVNRDLSLVQGEPPPPSERRKSHCLKKRRFDLELEFLYHRYIQT